MYVIIVVCLCITTVRMYIDRICLYSKFMIILYIYIVFDSICHVLYISLYVMLLYYMLFDVTQANMDKGELRLMHGIITRLSNNISSSSSSGSNDNGDDNNSSTIAYTDIPK